MKVKVMGLFALAALSAGALSWPEPAEAQKAQFERSKPTVAPTVSAPKAGAPEAPRVTGQTVRPHDHNEPSHEQHPDLVLKQPFPDGPFPGTPKTGFCSVNEGSGASKSIHLGVRNRGTAPSGSYAIRVTFPNAAAHERVFEKMNNGIAPGPTHYSNYHIPASAWSNGQASFHIQIDANAQVDEGSIANEKNNTAQGFCIATAN